MYEKFYGFKDRPFSLTPDSHYYFNSPKHEEALNCLLLSISERNGFVVLTGEVGSGKTTICRTLIQRLGHFIKVALILNTHLSRKEMLTTILDDLGIEYSSQSKTRLLTALNEYLVQHAKNGDNVVLIVDEAQNLSPSVMEELRMLTNLETDREKLLQIILIGQPELRKKLELPRMEQFRQRVSFYYHLGPLDLDETKKYIRHRLALAGHGSGDIFTEGALSEIFQYSKGIPRLINLACHSALISGLVYETRTITREIAIEAINDSMHGMGYRPMRNAEMLFAARIPHYADSISVDGITHTGHLNDPVIDKES